MPIVLIHGVATLHRPGGLFAVYSGPAPDLDAGLVRPASGRV
jgi:hypothetical protein